MTTRLTRGARLSAALTSGLIFALGQPPWSLWPLALGALALAVWLFARSATRAQAGWTGWAFGLGYFGLSMNWITEPFMVDAAVTGFMAPFALAAMAGGLALFWALAFWLARAWPGGRPALALVAIWTLAELARAYVLTGFPWGLVGYVLAPTPLVQWAALIGPHGLSLIALGLAAVLARADGRGVAVAVVALGLLWAGGLALQPAAQDLTSRPVVRLVQPNAPQHQKWDPAFAQDFFDRQIAATSAPGAPDLILWSETAIPVWLNDADRVLAAIADAAGGVPVGLGVQRYDGPDYFNTMVMLDVDGVVTAQYDKHHLVPFGEYMPFPWLFAGIETGGLAARAQSGFSPGPGPLLLETPLGPALPLICYEAVFPQDVTAAPARPAFVMQLTNDAWFGTRSGPYQHLMQARMRAIETGLPLVRAANTGVSAVIDPGGRVVASLGLGVSGYLDAGLPAAEPPTLYWRTGDLPLALMLLAACGLLAGSGRRLRNPH